ncbi:MAG: hypothetical protein AAB563_02790, partial [Patescibacteria group bacterium]
MSSGQKLVRKIDGVYKDVYRQSVTLIWNTWRNNPFRIPILLLLILLTMTSSAGLLYIPKTPLKPAAPQPVLAKTYAYTPTSGTLVTGTETQVNAGAVAAAEGVNTGSWKGTLVRDSYHWIVDSVGAGTPNLDVQLNFVGVQLQNANKIIIHSMFDLDSATLATQVQICDWTSTTSVDYAADAQCTGGGWRILNTKNTSNASIDITPTTNIGYQWQIYDGYWATGTTGGTPISTPLSNFIDGSGNVKIRYYSDGEVASNIAIDDLRIIVQIDPNYYPASFTQTTGGTPSASYINTQVIGNLVSGQQNINSGDANRLQVPGTAGAISDFYLSFKDVRTYTGANTIYARADYSCSATGINHTPKIYNFNSGLWEDLTTSAIACSTSDAVGAWAKNNVTISNYISSNEIRIGWYGSGNSTTTIRLDFLYIMIGSTNDDSAQCEITFGSGTATNCTNTRNIDLTGTTATFDNTAADESNTYGNDFYPYDNDADATTEEATASNINFPVTLPSSTQLTNAYYAARFAAGTSATAPALVVQPSLREYLSLASSGNPSNGFNGGWLDIKANTSGSATQANNDSIQMINLQTGAPYWGMLADNSGAAIVPTYFLDTVNNVMNMRLRSSTSGETTNNSVTAWDFAMVSISWVEDTANPTPNRFSYVPTSDTLVTGAETSRLAATAPSTSGGVNTGGWQGTLAQDGFQWVIAGANVVGTNYNAQLNLKDVKLLGANMMRVNTQVVTNANIGLTFQICDWVSTTSVDAAADANCTGGGWRSLNTKNVSNADVTFTSTSATTGTAFVWNIYNGYWSTGTTGGASVSTPLTNFVDATVGVKIRFYSTTQSSTNLGMDYVRVQPMIDSNYQPASYTNLGSGTATGTYVNAVALGNSASAAYSTSAGLDDLRLQVPGTAGTIADFYLSYKGIRSYTGANTVLVGSQASCSTTGVNVMPKIYNFTSAAWEDLSATAWACSTTDTNRYWAKNNITLADYIAGGEARVGFYGSAASTLTIRVDTLYVAIGTTNTDTSACEITFGSGTATNCSNTRDIDTTGTINTFDNPAEDESTTMGTGESNSYFVADNDQDAVIEEATASNVTFSLSLPSNTSIVASHSYFRAQGCGYTGNACGATALAVTPGTRYYDGNGLGGTADGGWKGIANSATSSSAVFSDTFFAISAASSSQWGQNNRSKPYNFLNSVAGTARMRLSSSASGTSTSNVTTSWDFAMVSVSWLDIGSTISIAGSSNVDAATVAVAVDGVAQDGKTATVASSAWSISNVFVRNAATVIVWHDGATDANESTGITVWDSSGNITGMVLTAHTLSVGSADNQSNAPNLFGLYDYRADEDVMHKYTGTTLAIDPGASYTDEILDVLASNTLAMGSDTLTTFSLSANGTFTGTGNITATGNVAGTGTITMTAGTFEQRVGAAQNFGTTSGSTAWTFYDLTFSNSHASSPFTVTTQTGGSGGITVSDILRVGKSLDAAGATTTLDAGNRTWTLSGTAGDPFQILASPAGVLTASTSTFTYTGDNGAGNTTIQAATYYHLTINEPGNVETYVLEGTTNAGGNFTLTLGTVDTVSGSNHPMTVTGDWSMASTTTFKAQASTLTVSGNWSQSNTTWSTQSTGYGTSTVVFSGTTKTITTTGISTHFYKLTISGGASYTEATGSRINIVNDLNIQGTLNTNASCDSSNQINQNGGTGTTITIAGTLGGSGCFYVSVATPTYSFSGTISVSNFQYSMTSSTTIPAYTYGGNLYFAPPASTPTYTIGAGTMTVGSSFLTNSTITGTLTIDNTVNNTNFTVGTNFRFLSTAGSVAMSLGSASYTVGGDWNNADTAVITPGTSTVTMGNATAAGNITSAGQSFYNLIIDDTGDSITPQDALSVTNDLTMTAGTLNGTQNVTVNGNVAGTAGIISLTGGTFTQRVAAAKNFGTTSGSTAWTFSSLTFSNSHASLPFTVTTSTGGSGGITVSSILLVGASGDAAGATTTLDAGNRTWTLSGTAGDPFQLLASPAGALTASTSTFTYTGANAGGNSTIQVATYCNLSVGGTTADTYVLEGATTTSNAASCGDLTIVAPSSGSNTLDTVSGSNWGLTIGGNYTNNSVFTAQSGTVTFTATDTGNTLGGTLSGTSAFYNLTFNGVAGGWTPSAVSTISNNLAITNGTVDDGGFQITGNATGTFTMASATTLKLGSGTATLFPATFTAVNTTLNAASTVIYNATVSQNISGTPTYGNIQLSAASGTPTKTLLAATIAAGTVTIDASNTLDVDVTGNYGLTIGSSYSNSGTFTARSGTVTMNATTTGKTLSGTLSGSSSFYNLTFNGSGGEWTPSAAVAVTNDLTMTAGSLLGTQNITVNGNVAGTAGIISLTGGTFTQRVAAAKNFGTTSGSTAWTFSSLTFSNSHASLPFTVTTSTGGSGGITVSSILLVGASGDAAGATTTLDAGNRTWTLSGTAGDPFQLLASPAGALTASTSTFTYTGANAGGNSTIQVATYCNLSVGGTTADTYVLEGATTTSNAASCGDLTIVAPSSGSNTLDTVSGSNWGLTIGGNYTNNSVFTAQSGTVTFTATDTGNTLGGTLSGTSAFYNLTFNGVAGGWTPSAVSTISNNLAITNGTVDDGGFQITGNATGTFTMASATTLKLGSGTATLFPATFTAVNTTLNAASTVIYNATVSQNISGTPTYGNIQLSAASGTPTKTLLAATIAAGTVTIDASNTLDVDVTGNYGLTIGSSYSNSGTFTARSGTVTMNATTTGKTLSGTLSGSSSFYNLTFNGSGGEWTPSAAVAVTNDLTMTAGSLLGTQNITVNGNVAGTAGTINLTGGTFEQRASSSKNFGTTSGTTAWTFSSLTFSSSNAAGPCGTVTYSTQTGGSGGITMTSVLLVGKSLDSCPTTLDAGNRTWMLSGTAGNPFQLLASPAGALTASTSTFTYTGNNAAGNTTVQTATFYNLDTNNSSETFVLEGTTGASNDLTVTLGTLDTTASNYAINVTRDMTINGTFTANASTITVSRNWTFNTGATLNRGTSTVVMNGDGSILGSASTQFQNLSIGYSTKTTTLAATTARTDAFGTLTLNGGTVTSSLTYSFYSIMASAGTYTPVVFASATTLSGASVGLYYRAMVTGVTINIAGADHGTWNVNPYSSAGNSNIWNFAGNVTTTGTFQPFAGTGITGMTVNTANFSLTAKRISIGATSNLGAVALNLGSSAVTLSNGTSDAILMTDAAVTHTLDMGSSSIDVKGNVLFVNGSASVTVTPGTSTLTWTNTSGTLTYAPNGQSLYNLTLNGSGSTVTPNAAVDINNNLTITAGTFTAPSTMTIGGNYSNSGTFTHSSGTVTFDATDIGNTLSGTLSGSSAFNALVFNGSGGEWTPSAAVAIANDLTVIAGTLLGTQNIAVSGGGVAGNGSINLTGGTFTLTGNDTFGGDTAWTFYNLTFGDIATGTSSASAIGSGSITVSNVLTVTVKTGLGCIKNLLTAGSKTWTLSGTTGTPLVVDGTLTPSTSTITFTGNNAGGNTNVPGSGAACGDATYYNLTLNNASETYAVSGTTNLTVNNNLTITAGTFTAGSGTTTVKGNFANSGTFTANSGTVTLSGTSTQTLSGTMTTTSAFYDLTITNTSGTVASDCERTGWVAGVDFDAAATVTNNYTIAVASVKVEYNSGSTYTINNMNWNGQAVGTRLYFRNSAVTGTWLLNVTAVGNAQTKVSYINVSRSDASSGALIIASDGTNTDCSNNTNWQFDETLTLGLDSTSKDFGVVTPGANPSDQTTTLTATSNAVNGYVIYAWSTQAMTNVRFGGVTLDDWTGTNATPTTFSAGSYGFGYTTDDSSLTGGTADRFTSGGAKYAGFTHS